MTDQQHDDSTAILDQKLGELLAPDADRGAVSDPKIAEAKRLVEQLQDQAQCTCGVLVHSFPSDDDPNCPQVLRLRQLTKLLFAPLAYAKLVGGLAGPVLTRLSTVEPKPVNWRWSRRLPMGKMTLLVGDPGMGKSWLSLAIGAAVTTGDPLPGESKRFPPQDVLILTAEDGLADTVRPRMESLGADLERVDMLTAVRGGSGKEHYLSLADDLRYLEDAVAAGRYGLVIIDPLSAYMGKGLDTHRVSAVRAVLTPLASLAERYDVSVLAIAHLTKSPRERTIYRIQESVSIPGQSRVVHLVGMSPHDEQERVMACIKNNLSREPKAITYRIEDRAGGLAGLDGRFVWGGESEVTADALVGPERSQEERSSLDEAQDFLRQALADGPRSSTDVQEEATKAGISLPTLNRAKRPLKVHSARRQVTSDGKEKQRAEWWWSLEPQGDQERTGVKS